MRRPFILALVSSASLGLLTAAGCSSTDDPPGGSPNPDSGSPDSAKPVDDASTPDADASPPDSGPHAPGWDPDFSLPGVAAPLVPIVNAMARVATRQIAIAGDFEQAGSTPTQFVALWNGNKWLSISSGLTEAIEQMVATPSGELFGTVREAGNTKIVKWNKTVWSDVATLTGTATSIDVGPDGKLYVAGWFTAIGVLSIANAATFDGTTWAAVPGAPEGIQTIRVLGNKVCIGVGASTFAVSCSESGGPWIDRAFGPDAYGEISEIAEQNGQLVIAGRFSLSSTSSAGSIARWNGVNWELVGGGVEGMGIGTVKDMVVDGSRIYITGDLRWAGGQMVSHVAMFDTVQNRWSTLNDGIFGSSGGISLQPPGQTLIIDQGGEIYVGGRFSLIGGRNALGIARWDGNQWNPVDDPTAKRLGVNGSIAALAEGANGALYAGGSFEFTGGDVAAAHVARFENEAWSALGVGFDGPVSTLAVHSNTVYAGGSFLRSGPVPAANIAKWNSSTWSGVGAGVDGRVAALVIGPDAKLYAGGGFEFAGNTKVGHVARWTGEGWEALGSGFDADVDVLAFDSSGKLYAGGNFTRSGETEIKHIAVWDGAAWAPMGDGVDKQYGASVHAIAVYQGKVVIGGSFEKSGPTSLASIAAWNGTAWESVGGGLRGNYGGATVATMRVRGSELYVGGSIARAGVEPDGGGGLAVRSLAMWNGNAWSDVGGGVHTETARSMVVTDRCLWVGGNFTFAGDQGSYNIGRFWFEP